jgi:hypothetical protein
LVLFTAQFGKQPPAPSMMSSRNYTMIDYAKITLLERYHSLHT